MNRFILALVIGAALPVAALAQSYTATLSGAGEGIAIVSLDDASVRYSLLLQSVDAPSGAQIHRGSVGATGDAVINLQPAFSALGASGVVQNVPESLVNEIRTSPSSFYVRVSSAAGEVRGQLGTVTTGGGSEIAWLPVVGRSQGAAGTNFITDVRLVNTSAQPATVVAEFWASSTSGHSEPSAAATFEVAAGAQEVINNVTGELFNAPNGLGALRFTSSQPLIVSARVNNDLREAGLGTTGFAMHGVPPSAATESGTIPFLSQSDIDEIGQGIGFRTNLGWFNPGDSAAQVVVTARASESGDVIAVGTLTVPAGSHVQQQAIAVLPSLATAPAADRTDFYLTYQSSKPIFFYGSVVDNRTGDSVYID